MLCTCRQAWDTTVPDRGGRIGALGYLACLQFVLHVYFGLDGANGFCEYNIKVEIIPIQDMLENCLLMGQGRKGKK